MTHSVARRAVLGFAAVGLAGLMGSALAQTGPGPGMGPGMGSGPGPGPGMGRGPGRGPGGMGGGMRGGGMMGGDWTPASYLDSLKTELAITTAQEPAWKEYADTVTGTAEQMQGVRQSMYDSMGTASWQERRDMMNNMFAARQNAQETVQGAAQALLPKLDAAQKAKAETSLPGLVYGRGMMRRR